MKLRHSPIFAALLLSAGMSHAALIIYEPFADSNATLVGNTPGTGLTGTYTSNGGSPSAFAVSGSSLSYGSQPATGGSATFVAPSDTSASNVSNAISTLTSGLGSLAGNGLLTDGAVLWFSVMQRTTNDTAHDGFALALGTDPLTTNTNFTAAAAQGIGFAISNTGNLTARVSTAASTHANGTNINRFSLAATILVVGRITWGAAGDTVDLYLPDTSMNLGAIQSSATGIIDQSAFDTLSFHTRWQGSTTAGANTDVGLDEIRFGSTLGDVLIPEPSAALLGGLGLLALFRRRR